MTDPIVLRFIEQAPFLAAFIWLVVVFLKHIRESDVENREVIKRCTEMFEKNAELYGRTSEALNQCTFALERHDGRIMGNGSR